jgi:hypothetical protein
MNKIQVLLVAGMMSGTIAVAMEKKKDIANMRTFALEFQQNKQDERKNTFLHTLAFESQNFEDWSEVTQRVDVFMSNHKKWMPNPFILNENGKTARQEAKTIFAQTGNPVSKVLVMYFKQMEDNAANSLAIKSQRDVTIAMQKAGMEFPSK